MDEKTKVTLSAGELTIASDRDIILTKRIVTETASHLFSAQIPFIDNAFPQQMKENLPGIGHAKISKGENYKGFPYVIMDYPALFNKDNVFALRTMFWWGHFFSITLHLSGKYKELYSEIILRHLMHTGDNVYVCVEEKEWEHHFEENNYRAYSSLQSEETEALLRKSFFKIALKYELHHWNMMQSILPEGYTKIFNLLSA